MIKILFISSGNSKEGISPIIRNQGKSIEKCGYQVSYYAIKGRGILGYLRNIIPLRKHLTNNFDIVHAHYSLSAFTASLAGAKPLIVSLMGSDVKSGEFFKLIIKVFNKLSWSRIIVKSDDMKTSLGKKDLSVIPNGVDINMFKPLDQVECKKQLNWSTEKKQILFAANPLRQVKNFQLAQAVFALIGYSDYELKILDNVPNKEMVIYYNAADVVLLTSLWEGSPNAIKEAMACNRPIVCTDVGDVNWLLSKATNCFVTSFNEKEIADSIDLASQYRTSNGRELLIELDLDSDSVANKIIDLYKTI